MRLITALLILSCSTVIAATHYVDLNGTNPVPPYINWDSAATNIQEAVDAAIDGDTVVVTNGYYYLTSQILVTNDIVIQSVNGPGVTIVSGNDKVLCFNLGSMHVS